MIFKRNINEYWQHKNIFQRFNEHFKHTSRYKAIQSTSIQTTHSTTVYTTVDTRIESAYKCIQKPYAVEWDKGSALQRNSAL